MPPPTIEDRGKVPTVQENGTYGLENIPRELPIVGNNDIGKFLGVGTNAHGDVLWDTMDVPTELPTATNKDVGKVVTVDENGSYALAEAGGSESVVVYTAEQGASSVTVSAAFSEIYGNIVDGKTVMIRITGYGSGNKYNCTLASWDSSMLIFTAVYYSAGNWQLKSLNIPKDDGLHGDITFTTKQLT